MNRDERNEIVRYRLDRPKETYWEGQVLTANGFHKLGKFYSSIFNSRQTGDYDDLVSFDKEKILLMLEPANRIIKEIDLLLKNRYKRCF